MLSIYTLKSAAKASDYYQEDNYYAKEGEGLQGQWFGLGAEKLNLTGVAKLSEFKAVLEGKLSSDISMKQVKNNGYHRPGYDLTFSAPKSVSILAVVSKDERVLMAHRTAIQLVLKHIEENYAATRINEKGKVTIEKTNNLIVSLFEHTDSRALDPNLHTHCVIMNATLRSDGEWRTLFGDKLYEDKILLGAIYRSKLVQELMKLGFEIIQVSEKGLFELKDFPEVLIEKFSKRRAQIKENLAEIDLSGGKAAKIANFNTREDKRNVDPEHLDLAWTIELQACGYHLEWLKEYSAKAYDRGPITPPDPYELAHKALNSAIRHLSEWRAVFTLKELTKAATALSVLNHSSVMLDKALAHQFDTGALLYLGDNLCTTQAARDIEIENIANMRLNKNQVLPMFGKIAAKFLATRTFQNLNLRKVFAGVLVNRDRQIVLESRQPLDYVEIMKPFVALAQQHAFYPIGITQSANRIENYKEELGLSRVQTISGLLFGCKKRAEKQPHKNSANRLAHSRQIWILDIKSSISLSQVRDLQGYANHFGARIIWSFNPFKKQMAISSLLKAGIGSYVLFNGLKQPVFISEQEQVEKVFKDLQQKGKIHGIPETTKRLKAAVEKYLQLPSGSGLLALTNYDRHALNEMVREAKIQQGEIVGSSIYFETLQPMALTLEQKSAAKYYQSNDIVKFVKDSKHLNVSAGSYLTVSDIQLQKGMLVLKDEQGNLHPWKLSLNGSKKIQLYRQEIRALQLNDMIVWNQTIRHAEYSSSNRLNGESAKVVAIEAESVQVQLKNNIIVKLHKNNISDRHWDYGYASMLSKSDPLNFPGCVIVLKSQAELSNYPYLAEMFSKVNNLHIFCDDVAKIQDTILKHSGQEIQALDKPVTHYSSPSENTLSNDVVVKNFFPKLNARLEGSFANHRELLTKVMYSYHQEKIAGLSNKNSNHDQNDEKVLTTSQSLETFYVPNPQKENKESFLANQSTLDINDTLKWEQARAACHAIDWLSAKYSERDAVFGLEDLKKELLISMSLNIPENVLIEQLDFALNQKLLIPVEDIEISEFSSQQTKVATKETVALERACLYLAESAQGKVDPIMLSDSAIVKMINNRSDLTQGQKSAIQLALTTSDRVIGIQGVSGAGKTTMLKTLNRHCIEAGFELLGLSNSTNARNRLQESSRDPLATNPFEQSGIKSLTTRKFTIHCERLLKQDETLAILEYGGAKLLILDEASFASTRDMFALLNIIEKLNIRLMVMGDYKQLDSVEAGRIFYLLLGSKMRSVAMAENVRFKSAKALETMQHIYKNQIAEALQNLQESLVEIADPEERLKYIADLYLRKDPSARVETLVITPLHTDRKYVNEEIHKGLKLQGQLTGVEFEVNNLAPINMTQVEKEKIYYFKADNWIRFNQDTLNLNVEAGEYCQVISKNFTDHTLLLRRQDGTTVQWSPEQNTRKESGALEIYTQETRNLMANERIRWLKNDEKRGIRNGEIAEVISVYQQILEDSNNTLTHMEVLLSDGTRQHFDLSQHMNQHWDYAYASTAFVAQGADKPETIAHGIGGYSRIVKDRSPELGEVLLFKEPRRVNPEGSELPSIRSKWVRVMAIDEQNMIVQDRMGKTFKIDNNFVDEWISYPNPSGRSLKEIPKTTSVEEFLVTVTRGDKVTLVVDNIEAYQHTLISKLYDKKSAQEYLDPNRLLVRAKVDQMTQNVTGKAKVKNQKNQQSHKEIINKKPKTRLPLSPENRHSLYSKGRFFVDKQKIVDRLHSDIFGYATRWLGMPQKKDAKEARWGTKGSRVINISGPKAGCWHDFEASKGGNDLISLYVYHYNIDYKEALKELANDLGIENKEALFQTQDLKIREQKRLAEKAAETQKKSKALIQQEAKKLNFVRETYAKCMPIKGTLAEKYLREFRGITGPLPEDFRFAPKIKHRDTQLMTPALVAPIRNAKGEIQSIVRTFLEKEGSKLNAKFINAFGEEKPAADKLNLGSMENAAVIVNKGKSSGIVYIAEGIETALSVAQAVPRHTVFAALSVSHLKNVPIPPDTQTIILCADEDGVKADSNQSLIKAVNFYLERGVQVGIAYPSKVPSLSKTDFNDLLKYAGTAIVAKDLKQTIAITEALTEQKLLQMRNDLEYTKENINKPLDKQIKELER